MQNLFHSSHLKGAAKIHGNSLLSATNFLKNNNRFV